MQVNIRDLAAGFLVSSALMFGAFYIFEDNAKKARSVEAGVHFLKEIEHYVGTHNDDEKLKSAYLSDEFINLYFDSKEAFEKSMEAVGNVHEFSLSDFDADGTPEKVSLYELTEFSSAIFNQK
mgnify:CR=1 FL=1